MGAPLHFALRLAGLWIAGTSLLAQAPAPAPTEPHLDFLGKPAMLDCAPLSSNPCFRVEVTLVGPKLETSSTDRLAEAVRIQFDDLAEIKPFLVTAAGTAASAQMR